MSLGNARVHPGHEGAAASPAHYADLHVGVCVVALDNEWSARIPLAGILSPGIRTDHIVVYLVAITLPIPLDVGAFLIANDLDVRNEELIHQPPPPSNSTVLGLSIPPSHGIARRSRPGVRIVIVDTHERRVGRCGLI